MAAGWGCQLFAAGLAAPVAHIPFREHSSFRASPRFFTPGFVPCKGHVPSGWGASEVRSKSHTEEEMAPYRSVEARRIR